MPGPDCSNCKAAGSKLGAIGRQSSFGLQIRSSGCAWHQVSLLPKGRREWWWQSWEWEWEWGRGRGRGGGGGGGMKTSLTAFPVEVLVRQAQLPSAFVAHTDVAVTQPDLDASQHGWLNEQEQ